MKFLNINEQLYEYICSKSVKESTELIDLRIETHKLSEGMMQISPVQGQFMAFLVKLIKAENILEIGTFTGYSSICMAQALGESGKLIALDISEEWTTIARKYWKLSGVENKIELKLGPALETLDTLQNKSFDFIFIDADKENYCNYYEKCMKLLSPGGILIFDNVLWGGSVIDIDKQDPSTVGIRALNNRLTEDSEINISMLPISDGITMIMKK